MAELAWLVPLFPLISFVLLVAFGRSLKEKAAYVGIVAMLASFIIALVIFIQQYVQEASDYLYSIEWFKIGDNVLNLGIEVNQLNSMMLFIVTLITLAVLVYSKVICMETTVSQYFIHICLYLHFQC